MNTTEDPRVQIARDVLSQLDARRLVAVPGIPFPLICVLVAGVSFLQAPFKAAQLALLPTVLPGDLYLVGMGVRNITMQTAQMVGFAGGGVLINAINPFLGLALDAATFLASALCVRLGVHSRPAAASRESRPSFVSSARAGASLIWREPGLRILLLLGWLTAFLIVYEGLAAPYTAEFHGGPVAVGRAPARRRRSRPAGRLARPRTRAAR